MRSTSRPHLLRGAAVAVTVLLAAGLLSSITPASAGSTDEFGEGVRLDRQEETGNVGFIGTSPGRPIDADLPASASAATVATSFLAAHAKDLGLPAGYTTLTITEQHSTPGGGTAVRVGQSYRGIPVLGGAFVVNLDANSDILSVLGEASPITKAATTPAVTAQAAAVAAVAAVARDTGSAAGSLAASTPELMFYDPRLLDAPGPFQVARLAWVSEVRGSGSARDVGQQVVVDAASGTVALAFDTIMTAKNRLVCDAGNLDAQYPCTTPVWTEGGTPTTTNADIPAAYEYAGDTYDFFFTRFGRDSLNGAGLPLVSTVDYCPTGEPCPYRNAFWDGAQMVYGNGFAMADDVVAHELSHGFTDFSSSLFYYQQSGAINESMSDVFGELVDQDNVNVPGNDAPAVKWLLGEDVPGLGAIRSMADPPAFNDPDRMLSALYTADVNETDGGGVHSNSGVNNKAAFLMTDGGTFNGQTVTGLGITKAARIYYTVNNSMLVSGSDYADLANALRQACTNLASTGTDGITATDCAEVNKAVLATEMDQSPPTSPTSTAAVCPAGAPINSYFDTLESPTGQFVASASSGLNAWSYPQNPSAVPGFDATYATSGVTNIWGYNRATVSDSDIRMATSVVVPQGGFLHFNHSYGFEDDFFGAYDGGVLEYSTTGAAGPWTDGGALFGAGGAGGYNGTIAVTAFGNPLQGRAAFVRESNGYGASRADLSTLAGKSVMFRWRLGTDSVLDDFGWFIDDVRVYTCFPDTTPPETTITAGPAEGSTITTKTATFAFTSSEIGSTFQCKLDNEAFKACTSPTATATLTGGAHRFSVRAVDTSANVDPTPASRAFNVKKTPPNTKIKKHPKKTTLLRKAKFTFKSTESDSTFRCKLDGKKWKDCDSPKKYRHLKLGKHKFRVAATDSAGNEDATPATWKWKVVAEKKKKNG